MVAIKPPPCAFTVPEVMEVELMMPMPAAGEEIDPNEPVFDTSMLSIVPENVPAGPTAPVGPGTVDGAPCNP